MKKTGSESAQATQSAPGPESGVEPIERARLQADVASQRVRLAKEELRRARKRLKEARREARRARRHAAFVRKDWKRALRQAQKDGRPASAESESSTTLARAAVRTRKVSTTRAQRVVKRKSRSRR